jgi:hypothetical protein
MNKFSFELTENERLFLIMALGTAHGIPPVVSDQTAPPATAIELARRLIGAGDLRSAAPAPAPPTATEVRRDPQPAAPAPAEKPLPSDVSELMLTALAMERTGVGKKERLVITWKVGTDTKQASCWSDCKDIWPRVLSKIRQPAVYLVKKTSSGYLNIVGVK